MIKLSVEDYCQECMAFDPAAYECASRDKDGDVQKVIEVRCSRWELCANVARRTRKMTVERAFNHIEHAVVEMRREA